MNSTRYPGYAKFEIEKRLQHLTRNDLLYAPPMPDCHKLAENKRPRPIDRWTDQRQKEKAQKLQPPVRRADRSKLKVGILVATSLMAAVLAIGFHHESVGTPDGTQQTSSAEAGPVNAAPPPSAGQADPLLNKRGFGARPGYSHMGAAFVYGRTNTHLAQASVADTQAALAIIAESDRLISFGRSKQAVTMLRSAIAKYPQVFELRIAAFKACLAAHQLPEGLLLCSKSLAYARNDDELKIVAQYTAQFSNEISPPKSDVTIATNPPLTAASAATPAMSLQGAAAPTTTPVPAQVNRTGKVESLPLPPGIQRQDVLTALGAMSGRVVNQQPDPKSMTSQGNNADSASSYVRTYQWKAR